MQLQTNDTIFHNWKIKKLIGVGSFGTVYEIEREEFGHIYRAAAKVITIPGESEDEQIILKQGMTEENVIEYYRSLVEDIIRECDLMECMKGDSHIVSYEDHYVEQSESGKRWTIYIRMELLIPLLSYIEDKTDNLKGREVVKLGMDICQGLETCQKFNVVHRDIKLENIFISDTGHYKLGDFGISKVMEDNENAVSQKGTRFYMAPEILHGEKYDARVDIYSLGLVLFRLMNDNRAPFLPQYPEMIRLKDKEEALQKRLAGDSIPNPCHADEHFGAVIRKACSFRPEDRYQAPGEMRKDLMGIFEESVELYPQIDRTAEVFSFHQDTVTETVAETLCVRGSAGTHTLMRHGNAGKKHRMTWLKKQSSRTKIITVLIVLVVVTAIMGFGINSENFWGQRSLAMLKMTSDIVNAEKPYVEYICSELISEGREAVKREFKEHWIIVPEVLGMTETEAVTRLIKAGYDEENIQISYVYSNEIEKRIVIAQSSEKKTQVRKGSVIAIDVSLGRKPSAVSKGKETKEDSGWIWKAID
ncbi:MAG: protein kinase [Lachnospiraceae bacterium]|nr:protein kinase [Lachnospiraceae bacterium]